MKTPLAWIKSAARLIAESPLAGLKEPAMEPWLRDSARLCAGLTKPVRIAVLGEVKAGKSTLVNALVGQKVAPTDVLEATAVVQYLRHGGNRASIVRRDGSVEDIGTEDLFALLTEHRGDEAFARSIERVELALPLPGLETLEILDTPGLASMSEALREKTMGEICALDVVVWVFNAHHAGARDVMVVFGEVAGTGRPIIAVVNRINELAGGPENVVRYFEDEIDVWNVKAVIPTDAKASLEGRDVGVGALRRRLEAFAVAPEEAKLMSAISQMDILLHACAELHRARAEAARLAKANQEILKSRIVRAGQSIMDEIDQKVRRMLVHELFESERVQIRAASLNLEDGAVGAYLEAQFATFECRLQSEEFPSLKSQLTVWMEEAWRREGHAAPEENLGADAVAHKLAMSAHLEEMGKSLGNLMTNSEWNLVTRETAAWGAAGTAFATYAALAGANAAAIGIGAALSALVPPMLIAGAAVGAVKVIFDRKKKHRKLESEIDEAFRKLRAFAWQGMWIDGLRPDVVKLNETIMARFLASEAFAKDHMAGSNPESLIAWSDEAEQCRHNQIKGS